MKCHGKPLSGYVECGDCLNGAACQTDNNTTTCVCRGGYTGRTCETPPTASSTSSTSSTSAPTAASTSGTSAPSAASTSAPSASSASSPVSSTKKKRILWIGAGLFVICAVLFSLMFYLNNRNKPSPP